MNKKKESTFYAVDGDAETSSMAELANKIFDFILAEHVSSHIAATALANVLTSYAINSRVSRKEFVEMMENMYDNYSRQDSGGEK